MSIDPGELRHRVTLQQRAAGVDAYGQASGAWEDVATVWAKVEPLRGREFFAAGQMQASSDTRITIRYRAGVTPSMRVVIGGVPYEITSEPIDVDYGHHTLELMCASGIRSALA